MIELTNINWLKCNAIPLYTGYEDAERGLTGTLYLSPTEYFVGDADDNYDDSDCYTWSIDPYVSGESLISLLESDDFRALLENVNMLRERVNEEDDETDETEEELERACVQVEEKLRSLCSLAGQLRIFDNAADYIDDLKANAEVDIKELWPADETLDEVAKQHKLATQEHDNFVVLASANSLTDALLDEAQRVFQNSPEMLSENHVAALLKDSRINEDDAQEWRQEHMKECGTNAES